jgi:hypothetical protein
MINFLLGVAVLLFVLWLVLTLVGAVFGGLVHLLWILILVALAVWAFRYFTGRRTTV